MKFRPTVEEITRISEQGKYDVVPVSCELMSDFITPIEVMRILKNVSTHCFMLESAQADDTWGRYTFLGFDPKASISCREGEMKVGDEVFHTDDDCSVAEPRIVIGPEGKQRRIDVFV